MQTIKGADFIVRYDAINRILYHIYSTIVTPKSTNEIYATGIQLITRVGVDNLHGIVLDFRRVTRFEKGHMEAVQRESQHANQQFDLSNIPIALVVDTPLQEQIVNFTCASHARPPPQASSL